MVFFRRRLLPVAIIVVLVFGFGTSGYMLIEKWSLVEAFYMTTITLSTVGFSEVGRLSVAGRLFTVLLIFLGVGTIAYGFSTFGEYLVTAGLGGQLRRRQEQRVINRMRDHVILCGYGRVGQSAAFGLRNGSRPLVVIDRDEAALERARADGFAVAAGDATRDETLRAAGIERAWGLIVAAADDSVNLFIVLSARALNNDLYIVARSIDADNERKMRRAGANRVVSPYHIGGRHMANIAMRPYVTDFFDVVTLDDGTELWIEELRIPPRSPLVGKTLAGANVRRRTGVTVIAVLREGGEKPMLANASTRFEAGDELILLGTREQLSQLVKIAKGALS
jgi:voltage-gated potassium channel